MTLPVLGAPGDNPWRISRRERAPAGLVAAALVVGAVFAGPPLYLLGRTLVLDADVGGLLTSATTLDPLRRSLLLAVTVSALSAVLGTGLAWLTTRADLPGSRLWRVLVPLPLVIPSFVGAAALRAAFGRGGLLESVPDLEGFAGAVTVLTLLSYPYVYLPVAARLAALPSSPEESARLLGRRPVEVFRTVVLPQAVGAVQAGTLLVFLYCLSEFGAVSIVGYDTLTRVIFTAALEPEVAMPLSLLLGVLALAVVAGEQAVVRRRSAAPEGGRAGRPLRVPLGRWTAAGVAAVATIVGLALVAPLSVLGWWAVRGLARGDDAVGALAVELGDLATPVLHTALVGVLAAVATVAVVLPVAQLTARHRSRSAEAPAALVVAGFALPGLVTALALGAIALQVPEGLGLYQSLGLLVLAYVVHFGAQALRAAEVAVGGVPHRLDDAARVLGAGTTRRFGTVQLPMMLPGLLAGAGLVLLSVMKELPATLLLRPLWFESLGTRIWDANRELLLAEVGLTSLVLVALSGLLTWALVLRRSAHLA